MKRCSLVMLAMLLISGGPSIVAQSTAACKLNPTNLTVTICTPQARSSASPVESPVRVVAACTDSTPISIIQIYINGQVVTQSSSNQIDVTIPMATGSNKIGVKCKDSSGEFFSASVATAVSGGCTFQGPGTLVACRPETNSTVSSPVHFIARDQNSANQIHGMRVLDSSNQAVLFTGCGRNLDAWVKLTPGTYNFTVESLYSCTQSGSAEGVQVGPVTVN